MYSTRCPPANPKLSRDVHKKKLPNQKERHHPGTSRKDKAFAQILGFTWRRFFLSAWDRALFLLHVTFAKAITKAAPDIPCHALRCLHKCAWAKGKAGCPTIIPAPIWNDIHSRDPRETGAALVGSVRSPINTVHGQWCRLDCFAALTVSLRVMSSFLIDNHQNALCNSHRNRRI